MPAPREPEIDPILVFCAGAGVEVEPDFALPAQLFTMPHAVGPGVRRLMLAIFEDALRVLKRGPRGGQRPTDYDEAVLWVESEERWVFSFIDLCEVLGLDPGRMRERVRGVTAVRPQFDLRRVPVQRNLRVRVESVSRCVVGG